jgi:hypothetical protein
MARIFMSYRRTDTKWVVGRIYDRLAQTLNRENLFLDISDIEPGDDYVEHIRRVVGSCDVVLVVIGSHWLTTQDEAGRRRLDDPNDWVRVELATALERGIRVIPVLVDGVPMPESYQLPQDLAGLSRRNAKLVSFTHFHSDMDSLLRILEKVLRTSKPSESSAQPVTSGTTQPKASDRHSTAAELPLTISIGTLGGIATPVVPRGKALPAKNSREFSTAVDNQPAVTVELYWGEAEQVADNLSLGRFDLEGIPPARRGEPRIEITTEVNKDLIMTVTAKNLDTGKGEVLDAIDLSRIEVPEAILEQAKTRPQKKSSPLDVPDFIQAVDEIFGKSGTASREQKSSGGKAPRGAQKKK